MQERLLRNLSESASNTTTLPHHIILEDRRTLTATGVTRIVTYDEQSATLETQQGTLLIGGRGIQVNELSIESGELKIFGQIEYLQYSQPAQPSGGFFRRLIR